MAKMEIQIHQPNPDLSLTVEDYRELVEKIAKKIDLKAKSCSLIFVANETLTKMHDEYLDDPSETDVITFDLGDDEIEGEIYISPQQAKIQAKSYSVSVEEEISRLIIHGLLHLKGYDDLTETDRDEMKLLENQLVAEHAQAKKK